MPSRYPKDLLTQIQQITSKRPRLVLEHIIQHGSVTTEELRELYGYDHPPRAARDVRERGIPLKTETVLGQSGRRMARYTIDVDEFKRRRGQRSEGRRAIPAAFKRQLVEERESRCELCSSAFESQRPLQVDHRVPYEIGGDPPFNERERFMLVCAPCNRRKSWQCEHCPNWAERDPVICRSCFWAEPSSHTHAATEPQHLIMVNFTSAQEVTIFQDIKQESEQTGLSAAETIKQRLADFGKQKPKETS